MMSQRIGFARPNVIREGRAKSRKNDRKHDSGRLANLPDRHTLPERQRTDARQS
jgi:hypothetical protein